MMPVGDLGLPGNPFAAPGQWYRGNLHTHTTESDGSRSPEAVLEWHLANGYHFVAITDHDRVTSMPASWNKAGRNPGGRLMVLPGIEFSLGYTRQGSPLHCVAVGPAVEQLPDKLPDAASGIQQAWAAGAFVFVAHPHWSGFSSDELAGLAGVRAIEIFNTGCVRENHKGHALTYWDDLLGRGLRVWGVATDDSHWRDLDSGEGWLMVKAPALTPAAIVEALRVGLFYSTNQPRIEDIQLKGDQLRVRTSPATAIYWLGAGRLGWSVHAPAGQTLTEAEFELTGRPQWIRVEVADVEGRWAWSNPLLTEWPQPERR